MKDLLGEIMGGMHREYTPAEREQIAAFRQRERDLGISERQMVTTNAWLFCSCPSRLRPVTSDSPPGYAECIVHAGFMITYDGRIL